MKKLSKMMLLASFISTFFYSTSYPYIYAEIVKVIPRFYISIEEILTCISTITFCALWNRYSAKLFRFYHYILIAEILADGFLFFHVIMTGNLNFYFLLNVIIYSLITRNISCGGTKMKAKIHPTEELREKFDNNDQILYAIATLLGAVLAMVCNFGLDILFIFALIGNVIDNVFYLYIYSKIRNVPDTR